MSQTPPTPNPTNPTTVEDFNALKALRAAQADALDAQARLIASQRALEKAQAAEDPAAGQLATATQAANIAAQQKALSDAQAAMLKSAFTVPESGYTGEVKAGEKAGGVEAALLAARALNIAAAGIATKLTGANVQAGDDIVLYGGSDLPDFQSLIAFRAQYQTIDKALDEALTKMDDSQAKAAALLPPEREFVTPAMVGAGLDAANKLLGYFRTDYSIQGVAVTPDDLLLINALASALQEKDKKVYVPALYNAGAVLRDSPVVNQLNTLTFKRIALQQKTDLGALTVTALTTAASKLTADAGKLTADAASENDPEKKQKMLDMAKEETATAKNMTHAAADLKTVSDQGKVAVSIYDGLLTKITTPDDKGKVPLTAIIQQNAVRDMLNGGANLMTAKISSAGGTYYTRKNLWSFFGSMPFFTMGGVVVNYTFFNGQTGAVIGSGAVPIHGGFHKVNDLQKELDRAQPEELRQVSGITGDRGARGKSP